MLPSASPSGLTWQISSTLPVGAISRTAATAAAQSPSVGPSRAEEGVRRSAAPAPDDAPAIVASAAPDGPSDPLVTGVPRPAPRPTAPTASSASSSSSVRYGWASPAYCALAASRCTSASASRAAASSSSMCLAWSCTSSWTNVERRRVAQPERLADRAAQQPVRALQRGGGGRLGRRVAEHGVEDGRLTQVAGDPRVGDRDHAEPGVLDLGAHHRSHQLPHAFRVPAHLGRVRHLVTSAPSCLRSDTTCAATRAADRR